MLLGGCNIIPPNQVPLNVLNGLELSKKDYYQ